MSPNGRIIVAGDVVPTSPADVLSSASGLLVRISDGLRLDETVAWPSSECRRFESGRTLCRSADGRLRAEFDPPSVRTKRVKFTIDLRRLDIPGPFAPAVTIRVSDTPPVAVVGVDRVGIVSSCRVTANGMICRER